MWRWGRWWLAIGVLLSHGHGQGGDPLADVERLIQERRVFMAELGATLRRAWEKFDTNDLSTLDREARQIAGQASRISGLFPPGSFGKGSRARATISDQKGEFDRLSLELQTEAQALLEQSITRDQDVIRAQLLQVGSSCRACHKRFVDR